MFVYPCYSLSGKGQTTKHIFDSEEKAKKWCDNANLKINEIESVYHPTESFLKDNRISDEVTGFAWEKKVLE